jgi:hypothetical protein
MHYFRINFISKMTVGQCSVFCRSTFIENFYINICSNKTVFKAAASPNSYAAIDRSGVEAGGLRFLDVNFTSFTLERFFASGRNHYPSETTSLAIRIEPSTTPLRELHIPHKA